ncbi:hypothetical protein SCLCIDRAFT_436307 [Scleroderma citrinum Foug A]|uniref:Uncharacterized protein n=1 Tax=Scleroderma citrinum Foug A TaxID=1036808 RepID=A0A0C3DBH2_9AGAM|nr:hypothetical protein SCLCIDRAFT_436307 [Scleroderma citrinum Foug A]
MRSMRSQGTRSQSVSCIPLCSTGHLRVGTRQSAHTWKDGPVNSNLARRSELDPVLIAVALDSRLFKLGSWKLLEVCLIDRPDIQADLVVVRSTFGYYSSSRRPLHRMIQKHCLAPLALRPLKPSLNDFRPCMAEPQVATCTRIASSAADYPVHLIRGCVA